MWDNKHSANWTKKKFMFDLFGGIFRISLKPILKNVVVSWYGEITLKIIKKNPLSP